ncbi:ABC transporter permease [Pseudophaeobacter arcticus]|uniref:ABC transporter permease n=1 Tax=Pseudophaeobacter arcticus TaxID=385492 RepID=UPI003A985736
MPDRPSIAVPSDGTAAPSGTTSARLSNAQMPRLKNTRSFAPLRTITALILREMATRYARTPGGYIWAIMEPLAAIIFLSIGFSLVIRSPALGNSFLLFYATAYMPFDLYNCIANTVARAVGFSKPLLLFPAVTWLDAVLARFFLNSLTSILVSVILLTGILALTENRTVVSLPEIIEAISATMLLGLGIGTLNCALMGLFPIWELVWSILTRPLFLASGIFFLYDDMPGFAREILWYNPLIHVIGLARVGFYPTYNPTYVNLPYVILVSLILLTLGLLLMRRYHRNILNT